MANPTFDEVVDYARTQLPEPFTVNKDTIGVEVNLNTSLTPVDQHTTSTTKNCVIVVFQKNRFSDLFGDWGLKQIELP